MSFKTRGEQMLQRELAVENRGGIPHFETGQHQAVVVEDDCHIIAVLSWVNPFGMAIRMMVRREQGGEWETCGDTVTQAGVEVHWGASPMPEEFEFSDRMIAVLDKAESTWLERFPKDA